MTRLIDADALLEAIYKIYGARNAPQGIINLITNAPTIQREGWVSELKSRMYRCCEHAADYEHTENYKEAIARVDLAFLQLVPTETE